MKIEKYVKQIESLIAEHQAVQRMNTPSSEAWQRASVEIHRLAALIVDAQEKAKTKE
jgi:hypothetical protein